jgi:hypothetical protein
VVPGLGTSRDQHTCAPGPDARPASAAVARHVALFNQRDWDGLRALLAEDVKLSFECRRKRV